MYYILCMTSLYIMYYMLRIIGPQSPRPSSIGQQNGQQTNLFAFNKGDANNHFIVDLLQSLKLTGPVLDICFVSGYSRPAIAVLQESSPLPIGHAANIINVCAVTVLAIDANGRTASVLWGQSNLPFDR